MREIISLILSLLFIFCGYTAYTAHQAKDNQSFWFFTAASFFFSIPLGAFVLEALGKRFPALGRFHRNLIGPPPEPRVTRFVPHWFVMTTILIMGLGILVRVIMNILNR